MKLLLVTLTLLLLGTSAVMAAEITESDTGTFVLLDKDKKATDQFYRLSKADGKWVMEGKEPHGTWKNISCDSGCEYTATPQADLETYFPEDWREHAEIACIQNAAQAFCRYSPKDDPKKTDYVVIARLTDKPVPLFVRRVTVPAGTKQARVKLTKNATYEKALSWIKENNRWGAEAGMVKGFKKELDSALGKRKAVWKIGWGLTKSGNAYKLEWAKDKLVITPYPPDKAALLGFREMQQKFSAE